MPAVSEKLKHPPGSSGLRGEGGGGERTARGRMRTRGMVGGRSSERERLPPFYSGADLHNDQRLSCLSKLFSAICIIFCRAGAGEKGWLSGRERERRNVIERWRGGGHSYSPFSSAFYVHDL